MIRTARASERGIVSRSSRQPSGRGDESSRSTSPIPTPLAPTAGAACRRKTSMTSSEVRAPASARRELLELIRPSARDLLLVVEAAALERLGALPAHDQRGSTFLLVQRSRPGESDRHHAGDRAAHEQRDAQERRERALLRHERRRRPSLAVISTGEPVVNASRDRTGVRSTDLEQLLEVCLETGRRTDQRERVRVCVLQVHERAVRGEHRPSFVHHDVGDLCGRRGTGEALGHHLEAPDLEVRALESLAGGPFDLEQADTLERLGRLTSNRLDELPILVRRRQRRRRRPQRARRQRSVRP